MTASEKSSPCLAICWTLSALVGIGLAAATSGSLPTLIAVGLGVAVALAVSLFLQSQVCGLAASHWGPFEGLKGVPGWDDEDPSDSAPANAARPAPPAPAASASTTGETVAAAPQAAAPRAPVPQDTPGDPAPDDLKRISGIGPKLEEKLNALGIHRFDQIAGWTPEQVAWVDDQLNFKGRIERDDWIAQARALSGEAVSSET